MVVHPVIVELGRLRTGESEVQVQVRLHNNLLKETKQKTSTILKHDWFKG